VSAFSALLRRLGHRPWFAALGRRLVPADRWLSARTHGRFVAFGRADLPSLLLTTTGRRSGQPRPTPLLYVADGEAFVVVGSNWGQRNHPSWTVNLIAHPAAMVSIGGREISVRARLTSGAERERLLARLATMWPAYRTYQERAAARELRVFRLEPD
jgi:deazaflavin-dependent oxidoreductase (nitroreductase family)